MKTFNFLLALFAFALLTPSNANAQTPWKWSADPFEIIGFQTYCMGLVDITISQANILNVNRNGYIWKMTQEAVMVDEFGNEYTGTGVQHDAGNWGEEQGGFQSNIHWLFRDNVGKLVGSLTWVYHQIYLPNGEIVANTDKFEFHCFK